MATGNPFIDGVEKATGRHVTDGYRPPAVQAGLVARGVTHTNVSSHSMGDPEHPGGVDLRGHDPGQEAVIRQQLVNAGMTPTQIIYETGQGVNQGTGPHYHVSFVGPQHPGGTSPVATPNFGVAPAGQSTAPVQAPSEIAGRSVFTAESGTDPDTQPIVNAFQAGPEAKAKADAVQADINATLGLVAKNADIVHGVQADRETDMSAVVAQKGDAISQLITANRQMVDNVSPLLAKRNDVDKRLADLATMNPLVRGIHGIFDLNYNDKYLKEVSDKLGAAASDQANNFQLLQGLQDSFLKDISAGYDNRDSLRQLKLANADQDAVILGQHLSATNQNLEHFNTNITVQKNLISAQMLAQGQTMEDLTPADRISLLAKAKTDPTGHVNVNGVPLSQADLANRVSKDEQQTLDIHSANMAYQSGQMELADRYASHLAGTMSMSQLQTAAANGGVYNGVKIPNAVITQNMAAISGSNSMSADALVAKSGYPQVSYLIKNTADNIKSFAGKATPMGIVKGAPYQALSSILDQTNQFSDAYLAAQKSGDSQGMQAAAAKIAELNTQSTAVIGAIAKSVTGDDTAAKSLSAYWLNQPVPSDVALDTMMGFVNKGGLPTAMRASPTFSAAYATTKKVMNSVDATAAKNFGGITAPAYQRWLKSPERREAIATAVNQQAPGQVNQSNFDSFNEKLPAIAAAKGFKFGGVSQQNWEMSNTAATNDMYVQAGKQLGVAPAEAQAFFERGIMPSSIKEKAAIQNFQAVAPQVQKMMPVWQRSSLLHHLDQTPGAANGARPSESFIQFVTSPEYLQSMAQFENTQGQFSYGDYVSGAMRGQGVVPLAKSYGDSMRMQWQQNQVEALASSDTQRTAFYSIPEVHTRTILGAMDGLSESDEATMMQLLKHQFPTMGTPRESKQINEQIRGFIMNTKLPDPAIDRIRKTVAKQWDPVQTMMEKAVERMRVDKSTRSIMDARGGLGIYG